MVAREVDFRRKFLEVYRPKEDQCYRERVKTRSVVEEVRINSRSIFPLMSEIPQASPPPPCGSSGGGDHPSKKTLDIIDHITADLQSYDGQYILLGSPPPPGPPPGPPPPSWLHHHQPAPSAPGIFYHHHHQPPPRPPTEQTGTEMIGGLMDVGGGNYVNVVFSKSHHPPQQGPTPQEYGSPPQQQAPTQPPPQVQFFYQQAPPPPQNLVQPHLIDFTQRAFNEGTTNGCLIENVVGNWAPNLNGTYSPFGGLPKDDVSLVNSSKIPSSPPISSNQTLTSPPQAAPVKKQRIVAEVKPMRPSYSDVLAKSPPLTPPPTVKQQSSITPAKPLQQQTPQIKSESGKQNKQQSKTSGVTGLIGSRSGSGLKRQSSSGSDDGNGINKEKGGKLTSVGGIGGGNDIGNGISNSNGCSNDRWSSVEDLSSPSCPFSSSQGNKSSQFQQAFQQEEVGRRRRKHRSSTKATIEKDDKFDQFLGQEKSFLNSSKKVPSDEQVERDLSSSSRNSSSCPTRQVDRSQTKPKPRDKEERKVGGSKCDRASASKGNSKNKRTQRIYKKRESSFGTFWKKWQEQTYYYLFKLTSWLFNLLWDVTAMSTDLLIHLCYEVYEHILKWALRGKSKIFGTAKKWKWWGKKNQKFAKKPEAPPLPGSVTHNITLPTTGEEAMKRLLSCKGKDPYSILGVTNNCTDEDIKKYYKSQALLVHPDKNSQPGAEEAFKILVHAFDLIAEPEKRAAYDRYIAETNQVEQAWSELSVLIAQLHEKMEYAANTIRCINCNKRHKRELTERPSYAARYCAQCKIHHAAKEGDMWAESRGWGWGCRYYACMGGSVYDITQWAYCQGGGIHRVKPDAHSVQYRVLLGKQQPPQPESDFEDLINSLYSQNGTGKRGKKKNKKTK